MLRAYKRRKYHKAAYLRHLRTLVFKPKLARAFLPLVILFLIVLLLLNNFVYFTVITSDSMAPTFSKGDMVLMTQYSEPDEGDIIMFSAPNEQMPVVHRVHDVEGDNITTKGDFNPKEDSWVINESAVYSEAVTVNGKPVVLKGVGNYFIEDYESHGMYSEEIEFNRLLLRGMKNTAIYIFLIAVLLYIYFTIKEIRERKA
ncbi:MAG: signal peptidase I [Thermoplasmata archaeon]|nr:MAG: signal peptidase I [Thermoplasmata archaeon]